MPEYIERESALKIVTDMMCDCKVTHKGRAIRRNINQIPTTDVVEVVRCKDCQHARQTVYGNYYCLVDHRIAHEETDYCSYGEKKEGAEE
jgi:hypothetical protein